MAVILNLVRTWRSLPVLGAASLLAACSSPQPTAYQLMQEQQQLQAQARQQEDAEMRKSAPTQPDMLLALVRESQTQGRHFAALAYVDAYVQKMGMTPEVAPLRAHALRMTGQSKASEEAYRALLSGARAAEGWHGLGLIAGANGDFATASDYLSRAAALSPTDADMLSDLGYARLRAGDLTGARLPLGQAAELNPASIKVIANLALLLLVEGNTDRAAQVMAQGGMSEAARAQLQHLAAETRAMRRPAPMAAATANETVVPVENNVADRVAANAPVDAPVRFFNTEGRIERAAVTEVAPPTADTLLSPSAPHVAGLNAPNTPYLASGSRAAMTPTTMLSPFMEQLGNTPLVR